MKRHVLLFILLLITVVSQAQTVYKTRTGEKYHVQSCRYLKSSFETTVAQAKAEGLTACSVCRPSSGNSTAASSSTYHSNGSNQTSSSSSYSSSSGSVQCSGTTKAGARCKRMTTNSNGRCYQH